MESRSPHRSSKSISLWLRGAGFTIAVPVVVGYFLPQALAKQPAGGVWRSGWIVIMAGAAIYFACLVNFLASGGTPAIFFTRHLRALIGEEPKPLVNHGVYRYSRNPMYIGVVLAVIGQAILFRSAAVAYYGLLMGVFFHMIVTLVEEPHLRKKNGAAYEEYSRRVRRLF